MSEVAAKSAAAAAPSPSDESAKARAAAAADAKAKKAALEKAAADRQAGKGPKVYANVNMMAKDGTTLVAGQETFISKSEYDRLKAEPRFEKKPVFFDSDSEEAKEAAFKAKMMAPTKGKLKKALSK